MPGAARINEKLKPPVATAYDMPTTVHVNLKNHPSMNASDVGKKIHFQGHGMVQSVHKDETEHRMVIAVKKLRGAAKAAPDTLPQLESDDNA